MIEPRIKFFTEELNRQIIASAVIRIQSALDTHRDSSDKKYYFLLEFVGAALFHMRNSPEIFDERCIMNISAIGDSFIGEVNKLSLDEDDMEYLLTRCYRFLVEFQLSSPDKISPDISTALSRVSEFEFTGHTYTQIRYASHQMLINIVQHYLYHPALVSLKDLPAVIRRSESERAIAEQKIQDREERVNALAEKLGTYETAFNFVGLYDGFKGMRATKKREKNWNFFYLLLLGVLLMVPFGFKIFLMTHPASDIQIDIAGVGALIGAELLFVYFFRVALHNFRSIKAQLIQLELRMTLCQFVQSYADYAGKVKEGSKGLLDRFEQIVFSGIVNDESAIPSTFDGLEQLAGLVEKVRK